MNFQVFTQLIKLFSDLQSKSRLKDPALFLQGLDKVLAGFRDIFASIEHIDKA